jgi:hypothetical protein
MKLEIFEDRMYFDQFAIRPEGSREFGDTIHFVRKVDALVAMRIIENWIDQEREACAQVCDAKADAEYATGKVDHNEMGWTQACAEAIRARGER